MTPGNMHDDSLDPVIRDRRYTGKPAVDALNSTVPQADAERRDALEQRLMARVLVGKAPGENRPMIHNAALQGAYETPRRFRISTSLLLTAAVGVLCAAVLVFSSFNPPPNEESPWVAAPVNQDQAAGTSTPTPLEATATPIPFEGQGAVPTTVPLTAVPHDPDSSLTATPVPFAGDVRNNAITHTVQSGDTILGIVGRYGIDIETLIRLNNLDPQAPLEVGRELVVSLVGMTPTPFSASGVYDEMTATPAPFLDANQLVAGFPPFAGGNMVAPLVWVPGDAHVSAQNSSGLIVAVPASRLQAMPPVTEMAAGQTANFYTTVGISAQVESANQANFTTAFAPVALSAAVLDMSSDGTVMIWVTLEQGIVLNWVLRDTPAQIFYERVE